MKFIKTILTLSSTLLFSGCASMMTKSAGPVEAVWLGDRAPAVGTSKDAKNSLTRGGGLGMDTYFAEATLYTGAYLEVMARERVKENLDSKDKFAKLIEGQKAALTNKSTCFSIALSVKFATLASAKSQNWVVKYRFGNAEFSDAAWNKSSARSIPNFSVTGNSLGHGADTTWYDNGIVCIDKKPAVGEKIELVLIPQIIQDHMKGQIHLSWN